jgi:tRNA pseudouridine38-40 synthase
LSHYRLVLAYDGTDFEGWQSQSRDRPVRTVQGVLEAALGRLAGGARVAVAGAGRTDAGVHATGQVASFALPRTMDAAELGRALNGLLPHDLRVLEAAAVAPDFHARRSARSKLYRYMLDLGPWQLPARRRFAAHVPFGLDSERMAAAASLFAGAHDFAALASSGGTVKTTVRTVTRSELRTEVVEAACGPVLVYEVEADGFLRKMVRSMVGGLIAVGRGLATRESLAAALLAGKRRDWPAPAPACGLTLVRVAYPPSGERVVT